MYYGVIDLGSNTVRLVIYTYEKEKYTKVFSEKSPVGILNYIEGGILSSQGIDILVDTLDGMHKNIELVGCEKYWCFATASLRYIINLNEVIERVKEKIGVTIEPISGEEEAYYDYVSLKSTLTDSDFIGCDIGGGSAQIIVGKKNTFAKGVSLPVGSLKMYKDHVEGIFPTKKEQKNIKKEVKTHLKGHPLVADPDNSTIYVMGGTARAIGKLHREMNPNTQPIHEYTLSVEELKNMQEVIENLGIHGVKIISKILPERMHTIFPGMIILSTIAKTLKIEKIIILKQGIREGFLIEKLVGEKQ